VKWILAGVLVLVVLVVVLLLVARASYRFGVATAHAHRRRLTDAAPPAEAEPVPELFTPEEERRRRLLREQRQKRAGMVPWNWHRPGMTEAERAALSYQLETGKLDKAIDQIVAEETQEPKP